MLRMWLSWGKCNWATLDPLKFYLDSVLQIILLPHHHGCSIYKFISPRNWKTHWGTSLIVVKPCKVPHDITVVPEVLSSMLCYGPHGMGPCERAVCKLQSAMQCCMMEYLWRVYPTMLDTWWHWLFSCVCAQIAKFMAPTWGPPGSCRPQLGPKLAPWTLLSV